MISRSLPAAKEARAVEAAEAVAEVAAETVAEVAAEKVAGEVAAAAGRNAAGVVLALQ